MSVDIKTEQIQVNTKGDGDIIDITQELESKLEDTGLSDGTVCVFVPGSTGAVTTIEYEPGLLKDLPRFYEKIIPKDKKYAHNDTWGDGNGFSHIRAALQGPSLNIPFSGGKLMRGTWQQIVFLEFDNRKRNRKIILQFTGK